MILNRQRLLILLIARMIDVGLAVGGGVDGEDIDRDLVLRRRREEYRRQLHSGNNYGSDRIVFGGALLEIAGKLDKILLAVKGGRVI